MDVMHGESRDLLGGLRYFSFGKVEERSGKGQDRAEKEVLQMGPGCFLACDVVDVSPRDAETPFFRAKTACACAVFLDR